MTLSQHYQAARSLSPKAARLAVPLLDASAAIPFEWRLSLRVVLVERCQGAAAFTTSDLAPPPSGAGSTPRVEAERFIEAVHVDAGANPKTRR